MKINKKMEKEPYVWYASYGSNLSEDRFMCYIKGGKPKYAKKANLGCEDKTPPKCNKPIKIPYPLYFAEYSLNWGGGVAFIGHQKDEKNTSLGRMWLITKKQFEKVKEQEGSWYSKEIKLGEEDGFPIFTITSVKDLGEHKPYSKLSIEYLKTIIEGIKETYHEYSDDKIIEYLKDKPGIKDKYRLEELRNV